MVMPIPDCLFCRQQAFAWGAIRRTVDAFTTRIQKDPAPGTLYSWTMITDALHSNIARDDYQAE
jgi:hypothetical protein